MPKDTKAQIQKNSKKTSQVSDSNITSQTKTTKKSNFTATKKTVSSNANAKKEATTSKKTTTKKTASTKKSTTVKKVPAEKKTSTKTVSTAKKASTEKKASAKKSATTKKSSAKKSTATKKTSSSLKKTTTQKASRTKKKEKVEILEYYDLPYRYNETVVKILAQTPTTLFVYWDISDSDREKYINEYGEKFFEMTTPILIVHNKTNNYSFEIEINDFANSWYFNVEDAKCNYEIELGRKKKAFSEVSIPNDYLYITSSNVIESPNNQILFDQNAKTVFFRNVKTNNNFSKDISNFTFIERIGKIYNIYDIYKKIYKNDELLNVTNNPTSGF